MVEELLSIGEVAERSGLAASAIRFYGKEGLIHADRTSSGQRVGLTLEEIVAALAVLPVDRAPTRRDWQRLTAGWRERLDQRIEVLEALRGGLTSCIGCGCLSLRTCRLANPDDVAATMGSGPQYLLPD